MKTIIIKVIFLLLTLSNFSSAQWVRMSNGINWGYIYSLASSGNYLFAGVASNGVYRSTDNGISWTHLGGSADGDKSLAANGINIFAGGHYFIYKSTDYGTSWIQTSILTQDIYALAVNGNNFFAGADYYGVYISTNNGSNWIQTSLNNMGVRSLAVNGNNVFAGTYLYGLYLSTNNGTSWSQTSLNNQSVYSLAINGNNVFAGTLNNGVYLSTNSGTNWTQTSLNNQSVYSLAINGNNVFAGTYQNGVYISNDNGTSWTQRNEGLGNFQVNALCISNNYILAGTWGDTVYRRPLSELTGIKPISGQLPNRFVLEQNYPNPFNPSTKIKFSIPQPSPSERVGVRLVIYNILGREAATLVNEQLKPGTYEVDWNASNFPSGVYFYKLITNGFVDTKKMMLVK